MAGLQSTALNGALLLWALWPMTVSAAPAEWVEGFEAGLTQARERQRPVFVYFDAVWCSWCQRYKRDTLETPQVRQLLAQHYVATRVDFDARPDLVKRYDVRGLPYTLILSPSGEVLNGFVGILTPKDMSDLLREFAARTEPTLAREIPDIVARSGNLDRAGFEKFRRSFLEHITHLYDPQHGTLAGRFETGATLKRPSPLTWMYLANQEPWRERARRAALVEHKRLHDPVGGGFFNFLDPSQPGGDYTESSKLLEGNAWLIAWFARVGANNAELKQAAAEGWRFLRERLWDAREGGFWQAQVADQRYYAIPPAQRRRATMPPLDHMKRADTNAQAAWALVQYARASGDRRALEYATGALDYVLATLWRDGRLYHHWRDGMLSTPDVPLDWFWVLGAGAEIELVRPEAARRQRLQEISALAANWLRHEMRTTNLELADPELMGLIAWVSQYQSLFPQIPGQSREWAIRRLHLRADTAPDDVVFGLQAWEQALKQKP
ncbi:MAG: thioredoxin family protein [Gammaproteobacteria bacterium]|nr:thioredoxin family protein [Gammaproteobacteria bacterium]